MTDHVAAKYAARVTSTGMTTRIREPRETVKPGETWTFASDVKARSGAKAQITVSWFNSNGSFLSWSGGSASAVSPTTWTRASAALKVPTGCRRGRDGRERDRVGEVRERLGHPARRPRAVVLADVFSDHVADVFSDHVADVLADHVAYVFSDHVAYVFSDHVADVLADHLADVLADTPRPRRAR